MVSPAAAALMAAWMVGKQGALPPQVGSLSSTKRVEAARALRPVARAARTAAAQRAKERPARVLSRVAVCRSLPPGRAEEVDVGLFICESFQAM
jgi:hypothetical protein